MQFGAAEGDERELTVGYSSIHFHHIGQLQANFYLSPYKSQGYVRKELNRIILSELYVSILRKTLPPPRSQTTPPFSKPAGTRQDGTGSKVASFDPNKTRSGLFLPPSHFFALYVLYTI